MKTILGTLGVAAALAGSLPAPALAAPATPAAPTQVAELGARARIWVEDERDYFRRGERLRVRFTTSDDSYVAVVHIDTDGNLDFLYPATPYDDGFVRRGRVYSLPGGGFSSGWTLRGSPGIGYLYLIASPEPLDYSYFGGPYGNRWDWSYAGRSVHGDPFWAMEELTSLLVPGWGRAPYVVDYYSYHVDGRHRYPSYACGASRWGARAGWGWNGYYDSCDRVDYFLRDYPYYYDARLYRGDRYAYFRNRGYYRDYDPPQPRHGYKEAVGRSLPEARQPLRVEDEGSPRRPSGADPGVRARPARGAGETTEPSRRRPTLERRGTPAQGSARPEAQRAPARGGSARAEPARPRPVPAKAEPAKRPAKGSGGGGGE